jgi:hypothetical protein
MFSSFIHIELGRFELLSSFLAKKYYILDSIPTQVPQSMISMAEQKANLLLLRVEILITQQYPMHVEHLSYKRNTVERIERLCDCACHNEPTNCKHHVLHVHLEAKLNLIRIMLVSNSALYPLGRTT